MARVQKITVIGAGNVGEATALAIAQADCCWELALYDLDLEKTKGVASDISQSASVYNFDTRVVSLPTLEALADSNIVILSAGIPRKQGMSRSDLLDANASVVRPVAEAVSRYAKDAIFLVVTNPVDVMTYFAWQVSGLPRERVFGMAGVLDSSRMASFIAEATGVSVQGIDALVIGGHGDHMLPLTQTASVGGVPLVELVDEPTLANIVERTRVAGADIIKLRKTGSAYQAPAAAIWKMVDAIVGNRSSLVPVTCILEGEYGLDNIAMGIPCILNATGVSRIVDLKLSDDDSSQLRNSADAVASDINRLPG